MRKHYHAHTLYNLFIIIHLQHRQSKCHARCNQGPPGTCLQPRRETHSHDIPSQTNCSSLLFKEKKNKATWDIELVHRNQLLVLFLNSLTAAFHSETLFVSLVRKFVVTHLVHSTVLHPPGGRCCFWLAVGSKRTESSRHAMFVLGHLSPPMDK